VLLAWGDPLMEGLTPFQVHAQDSRGQRLRFGFNCDFCAFLPLGRFLPGRRRGLLFVNHEFSSPPLMFPAYRPGAPTAEHVEIEMAAVGATVVAVEERDGTWVADRASPFNRRITATTPIRVSGPAAGTPRLCTSGDPTGRWVTGMLANCAGGVTPWGTVLTCEEDFHVYFGGAGRLPADDPRRSEHDRYKVGRLDPSERSWERHHSRFSVAAEPNEAFRFGWVVEVDPFDPLAAPVKRTALGRFAHEAASVAVGPDGRVAVYMGDDDRFEFLYKFVASRRHRGARGLGLSVLDHGTLHAARFEADGTGQWVPLIAGHGPLAGQPAFASQADVCILTRLAAGRAGATPMDRPEDVEVHPSSGRVYVSCTANTRRGAPGEPGPDAANPRAANRFGHVIEIVEDDGPTSRTFRWDLLLVCGPPGEPGVSYGGVDPALVSPLGCPDNLTVDGAGRLWVATDGQAGAFRSPDGSGPNDGLFCVELDGPFRGRTRQFLSGPLEAEITGPVFSPGDRALFVSIQHPGAGGTIDAPTSRWPDGTPRPAVVVVTRDDGGPVG
jgi:secreted PhoX family phosphatase